MTATTRAHGSKDGSFNGRIRSLFSMLLLDILNYKMYAVETPSRRFAVSLGRSRCLIEVTRSQTRQGRSDLVIVDLDRDTRSEGRRLQLLVLLHLHTLQVTRFAIISVEDMGKNYSLLRDEWDCVIARHKIKGVN